MVGIPPSPDPADDRRAPSPTPKTPRWVKVFGTIAFAVLVAFVILLMTGGNHGPGRHLPPGSTGQGIHQR